MKVAIGLIISAVCILLSVFIGSAAKIRQRREEEEDSYDEIKFI